MPKYVIQLNFIRPDADPIHIPFDDRESMMGYIVNAVADAAELHNVVFPLLDLPELYAGFWNNRLAVKVGHYMTIYRSTMPTRVPVAREHTEQPDMCPCHYCGTEITHFGGDWWEDDSMSRECSKSPRGVHASFPFRAGEGSP